MARKQMTIGETNKILNEAILRPAAMTYSVSQVTNETGDILGYSKLLRPANLGLPAIWSCGHSHATWNEAAECPDTPTAGKGEALISN